MNEPHLLLELVEALVCQTPVDPILVSRKVEASLATEPYNVGNLLYLNGLLLRPRLVLLDLDLILQPNLESAFPQRLQVLHHVDKKVDFRLLLQGLRIFILDSI